MIAEIVKDMDVGILILGAMAPVIMQLATAMVLMVVHRYISVTLFCMLISPDKGDFILHLCLY